MRRAIKHRKSAAEAHLVPLTVNLSRLVSAARRNEDLTAKESQQLLLDLYQAVLDTSIEYIEERKHRVRQDEPPKTFERIRDPGQ